MAKLPKNEKSNGIIFADLGLEDANKLLLKAEIVTEIARLMKQKKLRQAKAAQHNPNSPTSCATACAASPSNA
jgi:Helix-turn-helix domain